MATLVAPRVKTRADDTYFVGISILMLITVVAGFSRSYFFKGMVLAPLPSLLLHVHGLAFTSWIVLFVVQTMLVARRNLPLHRTLGWVGSFLAVAMVVLGISATIIYVHNGRTPPIFTPPMFLALNIYGILVFGTFVALAVAQRNNRPIHKRLMLLATLNLMPPATTRFFVFIIHKPALNGPVLLAFTLSLLVFDLVTRRRPYAVTILGGVIVATVFPMANALGSLPLLKSFAAYVLQQ